MQTPLCGKSLIRASRSDCPETDDASVLPAIVGRVTELKAHYAPLGQLGQSGATSASRRELTPEEQAAREAFDLALPQTAGRGAQWLEFFESSVIYFTKKLVCCVH